MDAQTRISKFLHDKPAAADVFGQLNQAGIRWGMFAGCAVSLLTGNRQATDLDILLHNDDFDRVASFFPGSKRSDNRASKLETSDGEVYDEEVSALGIILPSVDLEFFAGNTFKTAENTFHLNFSDLAVQNRVLFEIDGHRVYLANPFDTLLFKAFLRRGPERNKFDAKDAAALCREVTIDTNYAVARLRQTGSTPQVQAFLRKAGLEIDD
jgi:hypothetical protein